MKLPINRWTPQEEAILAQGYADGISLLKIAKMVGRNWAACGSRAKKLGLIHKNSNKKRSPLCESRPNNLTDYATFPIVFPPVIPTLAYVPGITVTGRYRMVQHVE